MKTYSTRYHRRNLLTVPYSVRPDHLQRGLRILRALRQSLETADMPGGRPRQCEFEFVASGAVRSR